MKNSVLLKGLFSCLMTASLVLGLVHFSAPPAAASFQCPETFRGNTFSHVLQTGAICCCIYETPSGGFTQGPSWFC